MFYWLSNTNQTDLGGEREGSKREELKGEVLEQQRLERESEMIRYSMFKPNRRKI
jgi:hypothetical protein